MATGGRKGRRLGSQIRVNSRCYLIPAQPPMKQARPEHFVMKRQGAHRAGTGPMACAAIAFPGSDQRCASVLPEQVFIAPGVPPALFPDLPGERLGSSHRSRKWGAAITLPPFLQSGSGLPAARGGRRHMSGQTVHLHPALQGCGWSFPEDLVNVVRVKWGDGPEGPSTW